MIDFRYHLVSIISIFLALAVGIVLGAGPLKGSIGTTLTQELANARQDKADLNDQLTAARRLQAASDAFASASLPTLVARRLQDQRVALVVGPGADGAAVKSVTDAVTAAGGQVVTTATLATSFVDAAHASERATTVTELAGAVGVPTPAGDATRRAADLAGAVLGRGLLQGAPDGAAYTPATGSSVTKALSDAGLVRVSAQPGTDGVPVPTLAVVVAGPVATSPAAEQTAQTEAYLGLTRGLDAVAAGTLLAGVSSSSGTPGGSASVVSAARASVVTTRRVSTVDDVEMPMGQVALALALAQERSGVVGRYGVLADAEAVVPDLPAPTASGRPAPSPTATPSPGATR